MSTTNVPIRPDVLVSTSGQQNGFVSSFGTAVCAAPLASNGRTVVNRTNTVYSNVGSSAVADPSGVVNKYNKRFNEHQYYTA